MEGNIIRTLVRVLLQIPPILNTKGRMAMAEVEVAVVPIEVVPIRRALATRIITTAKERTRTRS